MSDIYGEGDQVERALNLLKESNLSKNNAYYLEEFAYHLMAEDISDHKIYRYLQSFRSLEPVIEFDLEGATKRDLKRLVGKINHNKIPGKNYKPYSRKELKTAIRKFYSFLEEEEEPEKTEFISCYVKKKNRSRVDPDRLPTPKNVRRMKKHAANPRDELLVVLLWESGARIGELLSLNWEDVTFLEKSVKVDLDGKTGQRSVPVVESRVLLENLKKWQGSPEAEDPVFTNFQNPGRLRYQAARKQLRRIAKRADVQEEKKVNPHAFRKSRATWMASKGANIFQLMRFFGWSKSDTALVYVRMAQSSVDDLVLELSRQSDVTEFEVEQENQSSSQQGRKMAPQMLL